jgi:hypothetical protein
MQDNFKRHVNKNRQVIINVYIVSMKHIHDTSIEYNTFEKYKIQYI